MFKAILKAEPLPYSTIEIKNILYRTYDAVYGFIEPGGMEEKSPLASVLFHAEESCRGRDKLLEFIDVFKDLGIYETWGISLPAFLELPTDVSDYIIERTERDIREEDRLRQIRKKEAESLQNDA